MKGVTAEKQWQQALAVVAGHVTQEQFSTWFSNVELVEFGPERVELGVANRFIREWLLGHYAGVLGDAVAEVTGSRPELVVGISGSMFRKMREIQDRELDLPPRRQAPAPSDEESGELNPEFVLDKFVVGPSNRLAFAAATAVVEKPAEAYNPLFVFGAAGLGKTHLLQGICRSLRGKSDCRALYMPCESFVNAFILALQQNKIEAFRQRLRSADALVIDDIHFLASKARTQDEFFHTFDALHNMGRQVVISSDAHPREISAFKDKLITRFVSGLVVELQSPDRDTRIAILRSKAARRGLSLPADAVGYVADTVRSNVRELEGAVAKLAALSLVENRAPDLAMARHALRHLERTRRARLTLQEISDVVAEHYGLDSQRLRSRSRSRELATARHVGMYLSGRLTEHSLSEIGRFYGGRNHATVVHARKKIEGLKASDEEFARALEEMARRLER